MFIPSDVEGLPSGLSLRLSLRVEDMAGHLGLGSSFSRVEWCPERVTKVRVEGLHVCYNSRLHPALRGRQLLYVGLTEDLQGRENAHNNGRGSKYTLLRGTVQLICSERYDSLEKTVGRERQPKRWSHTKKKALIVGDAAQLKQLGNRNQLVMDVFLSALRTLFHDRDPS